MTVALKYASKTAAIDQIARELYHTSLDDITSRKHGAFLSFLRTRVSADPLGRTLVLSANQIGQAVEHDMTVSAIRAVMVEGEDILGGFLAPEQFHESVVTRMAGVTVVRRRAVVLPAMTDRLLVPRATGGDSRYPGAARITWVNETGLPSGTTTGATFGASRIPVYTAMANVEISRPLMEDASPLLMNHMERILSDSFSVDEDEKLLVAGGAGTPQGALPGGLNVLNLTEVTSGAAAGITAQGIVRMPFAVAPQYRRDGRACWVMGSATLQDVCELVDGAGRPLVSFDNGSDAMGRPMLRGFPVEEIPDGVLPTVAAGAFPVIFGDFSGVTIADRVGMSVEIYDDSQTAERNKVAVIARRRVGGQFVETYRAAVMKIAA